MPGRGLAALFRDAAASRHRVPEEGDTPRPEAEVDEEEHHAPEEQQPRDLLPPVPQGPPPPEPPVQQEGRRGGEEEDADVHRQEAPAQASGIGIVQRRDQRRPEEGRGRPGREIVGGGPPLEAELDHGKQEERHVQDLHVLPHGLVHRREARRPGLPPGPAVEEVQPRPRQHREKEAAPLPAIQPSSHPIPLPRRFCPPILRAPRPPYPAGGNFSRPLGQAP